MVFIFDVGTMVEQSRHQPFILFCRPMSGGVTFWFAAPLFGSVSERCIVRDLNMSISRFWHRM